MSKKPPEPAAKQGARLARALARRISKSLDATRFPLGTESDALARLATQGLALQLVVTEFLARCAPAYRLEFLSNCDRATSAGQVPSPSLRRQASSTPDNEKETP